MAKALTARRVKLRATAPPEKKTDQYFSRALEKGLQAIDELVQVPSGLTLMELSAKLELTKPSAFRILRTLESLGYTAKASNGKYTVAGAALRHLPARSVQRLMQHGVEPLQTLVRELRETVSLAALFENHIEVVMVLESPQLIRMTNTLGRILPPHGSSLGKAIAAHLHPEAREHLLRTYGTPPFTAHTITDETALAREFEQIRKLGHAEDWEESTLGGVCFAAPVLRPNGIAVGAISVSLPKIRLEGEEHRSQLVKAVSAAAAGISANLS